MPNEAGGARMAMAVPSSEIERAWVAAALSIPKLPAQLRESVAGLLTWETFLVVGGTVGAVVAAHAINPLLGVAIDVVVAGVAIGALGAEGFAIAKELSLFWKEVRFAESPAQLDRAAGYFASAVSRLGIDVLLALTARRTVKGAASTAAASRWQRLIAALALKTQPNQGALWSKISIEQSKAIALRRGRRTLEMTDDFAAFKAPYDVEFGRTQNSLTAELWESLSRRYADGLSGNVEVYTDLSRVNRGIQKANVKAHASQGSAEELHLLPQLTAEIEQIGDLMLQNNRITSVRFLDAASLRTDMLMTREQVLRAARGTTGGAAGTTTVWH